MKKTYRSFLKGTNWLLGILLGLLGISVASCDEPVDEYGTPYATYSIKGKVSNTKGEAIPGIEVKVVAEHSWSSPNNPNYPYKSQTQANGTCSIELQTSGKASLKVYATDIDGEENGLYRPDSLVVKESDIELTGGKGWLEGHGETNVYFTLKEADKAEEQE